ncbi:MAG: hypothetical protein ACOC7T_03670 [Planctomycetota bacterium]
MKIAKYVVLIGAAGVLVLVWWSVAPTGRPEPAPGARREPQPAEEPAPEAETEPIELELPEPRFEGTPRPVNVPNVEKPRGKPRPPFLAPEGTVNLARGRPVTTSDPMPVIGTPELVTDGDKEARFGTFLELGPGLQWVQIDLGRPSTVYAVVVWHYHMQPRVYHDVIVQVSSDPEFAERVATVFNNDHDNSSGLGAGRDKAYVETHEGRLIDCGGVRGRYVRLYSGGNSSDDMNHCTEVAVYGKPVE